jgi:hypothetical protein
VGPYTLVTLCVQLIDRGPKQFSVRLEDLGLQPLSSTRTSNISQTEVAAMAETGALNE